MKSARVTTLILNDDDTNWIKSPTEDKQIHGKQNS